MQSNSKHGKQAHACPKCNRIFDRKDNLQRHLRKKTDCSVTTTSVTENVSTQLVSTLLHVLRGPLKVDDVALQCDSKYEVRIVGDIWKAIVVVAEMKIEKNESIFDVLFNMFEFFNARQLEVLFGEVMVRHVPPSEPVLQGLRALYKHLHVLHKQGVPNLHRKSLPNIMRSMRLLPALPCADLVA